MHQLQKCSLRYLGFITGNIDGHNGVIISNDRTTMIYFIFKSINPATSIGILNVKYDIEKSTLGNFGNNIKDLLYFVSSNYSIIIDKGERHEE